MAEQVLLNIERPDVGITYTPASLEAEAGDELAAAELGLHALARHAVALRSQLGLRVPAILVAVIEAETFKELG